MLERRDDDHAAGVHAARGARSPRSSPRGGDRARAGALGGGARRRSSGSGSSSASQRLRSELDSPRARDRRGRDGRRSAPLAASCDSSTTVGRPRCARVAARGRRRADRAGSGCRVADLAASERQTVAIDDVELADAAGYEGREHLLGSARAPRSRPRRRRRPTIGVSRPHRAEARRWSPDEIALAEAVAQEVGLAIHVRPGCSRRTTRAEPADGAARRRPGAHRASSSPSRAAAPRRRGRPPPRRRRRRLLPPRRATAHAALRGRPRACPRRSVGSSSRAEGVAGRGDRAGRAVAQPRLRDVARPPPSTGLRGLREVMVAPITVGGRGAGVLGVGARGRAPSTSADLDVLEAFAQPRLARAAERRGVRRSVRQARVQRGFYRIASVLGSRSRAGRRSTRSPRRRLRRSAALRRRSARAATASSSSARAGAAAALREALAGGARGPRPSGRRASSGRILAAGAWRRTTASRGVARAGRARATSSLLRSRSSGATPATASCSSSSGTRAASRTTISSSRGTSPARPAARSSGASLFEEERRARALAQQLARTGSLLATELDPAAVLDEVVRQAPRPVGADACAIRVVDGDELVVTAVEGVGTERPRSASVRRRRAGSRGRGPVARPADRSRTPARTSATPPPTRCSCAAMRRSSACRSSAEGAAHGVLALYAAPPRGWRHEEVEALLALAGNASAALPNAELYQRVALEKERSFAILANIADGIVAVDRDGKRRALEPRRGEDHGVRPPRRSAARPAGARPRPRGRGTAVARRPARLDPARRRGGLAVGHRGGHARPGRRRRGPHLRVPRHLRRPASWSR